MMDKQDLEAEVRQAPLIERLEKVHTIIGELCAEGRSPRMSIPVRSDDEDFFAVVTLQDAIYELKVLRGICPECDHDGCMFDCRRGLLWCANCDASICVGGPKLLEDTDQ